jgi:acetyl-CoA hydrolase
MKRLPLANLDLAGIVKPGDNLFWGQGCGEPQALVKRLLEERAAFAGCRAFIGATFADNVRAEHADHLKFVSYGAIGRNRLLTRAGVLDVLPMQYSLIPGAIASRRLPVDVCLLQLAESADGLSFGATADFVLDAIAAARVVIAEVNDQAPWTHCAYPVPAERIDFLVPVSYPLAELPAQTVGDVERAIARHAAAFIDNGATIQIGIGAIPDAILSGLVDHRRLGIWSGMMTDCVIDLIEAGVIDNAEKAIDPGVVTTGVLFGTERLHRYAHRNAGIRMRPVSDTHAARMLGQFDNLVTINGAVEVDLTGQVNGETAGADYVGAVGGQVDFVRAGQRSARGHSLIALPATAQNGRVSRIVARASGPVTTARSETDVVVTEYGAASLAGCTVSERIRRMIAIAAPQFREQLEREAFELYRSSSGRSGRQIKF